MDNASRADVGGRPGAEGAALLRLAERAGTLHRAAHLARRGDGGEAGGSRADWIVAWRGVSVWGTTIPRAFAFSFRMATC